jgi:hypothetical protein
MSPIKIKKSAPKDLKKRSMRMREVNSTQQDITTFDANINSIKKKEYSSYSSYAEPMKTWNDANGSWQLCFNLRQLYSEALDKKFYLTQTDIIRDGGFSNNNDNDEWVCHGYRENWVISGYAADYENIDTRTSGYLFLYLKNRNLCDKLDFLRIGPGYFSIVQTASQINLLNDPNQNPFTSVSKFILDYCKNNSTDPSSLMPSLVLDEDIFYIEPVTSPLTFGENITASYKQGFTSNIKIISLIGLIITGTDIPLSEFKFSSFRSSDNDIAKVDTMTISFLGEIPLDTITLKQTGTFTLSGRQEFYQSQSRNVAYYKKDFSITINLLIYD